MNALRGRGNGFFPVSATRAGRAGATTIGTFLKRALAATLGARTSTRARARNFSLIAHTPVTQYARQSLL